MNIKEQSNILKLLTRLSTEETIEEDTKEAAILVQNLCQTIENLGEEKSQLVNNNVIDFIQYQIAVLDKKLSFFLDKILHCPNFQKKEESIRGLYHLVSNTETSEGCKIHVLDASPEDIKQDVSKCVGNLFFMSNLWNLIYEKQYGTLGAQPFTYMVFPYNFSHTPNDVAFLEKLAGIAAGAHCVTIVGVNPTLLNCKTYKEIGDIRVDFTQLFEDPKKLQWNMLRKDENTKYICLTLPTSLARLPYSPEGNSVKGFDYIEKVNPLNDEDFVWINSAYLMGHIIGRSYVETNWGMKIRGLENGGQIKSLNLFTFKDIDEKTQLKKPLSVGLTDRQESQLSQLGIISACYYQGTDSCVFLSQSTMYKPPVFDKREANDNARVSSELPTVLTTSRIIHYLHTILRNTVGSLKTDVEIKTKLQNFLAKLVTLNANPSEAIKAKYPLRQGRVDVIKTPGNESSLKMVLYLKFHSAINEFDISVRSVSDLPKDVATSLDQD